MEGSVSLSSPLLNLSGALLNLSGVASPALNLSGVPSPALHEMASLIIPFDLNTSLVADTGPMTGMHMLWRMPRVEDAVLMAAMVANCVLILAPLRSALVAANTQLSSKELIHVLAPTYMLFGQSYFWACYGYYVNQPDLANLNAFGALMCIVYLTFIAKGAAHNHAQARMLIALSIAMVLASSMLVARMPLPSPVFACAASVFSFFQTLAPVYQAADVVRATASPACFPLALTASGCVSSLLWAQYAWFMQDYLYLLSNTLNAFLGAGQLALIGSVMQRRKLGDTFEADSRPLMPRVVRKTASYGSAAAWPPTCDAQKAIGMYTKSEIERAMATSFGGHARTAEFDEERPPSELEEYRGRKAVGLKSAFGDLQAGDSDEEDTAEEPEMEPESYKEELTRMRGSALPTAAAILVPA